MVVKDPAHALDQSYFPALVIRASPPTVQGSVLVSPSMPVQQCCMQFVRSTLDYHSWWRRCWQRGFFSPAFVIEPHEKPRSLECPQTMPPTVATESDALRSVSLIWRQVEPPAEPHGCCLPPCWKAILVTQVVIVVHKLPDDPCGWQLDGDGDRWRPLRHGWHTHEDFGAGMVREGIGGSRAGMRGLCFIIQGRHLMFRRIRTKEGCRNHNLEAVSAASCGGPIGGLRPNCARHCVTR